MKKIVLFSLIALSFNSCFDLAVEPEDFTTPMFSYNTEEELNAALVGVYDALGANFLFSGTNKSLVANFDCADEMYFANSKETNAPDVYSYNSGDDFPNNIWGQCYKGIERANILLANIQRPAMNDSARAVIEGEVRFLRAFFHFVLVQNFGAIPVRNKPTASVNDVHNPRIPADSVYNFIYSEMVEAEKLVPPITTYSYAERVTKSAVWGVLARVSLFMAGHPNYIPGKYEDALYWCNKVIELEYHQLNDMYSQVFVNLIQDKYDTKESIWEVGFYTTGSGDVYAERGYLGTMMGIRQSLADYGISSPRFQVHEKLYSRYDNLDFRRDWNISPFYYTGNKAPNKTYYTAAQVYNRYIGKYRREFELVEKKINYNGTNFPLLRYADVLLMAAEAMNEINNGPTHAAIDYVNRVRKRGHAAGKSVRTIEVTNGGSGYVAAKTTIKISGGSPVTVPGFDPLTLVPVITEGVITAINIVSRGSLYQSKPNITIESTDNSGTGATASVVMTSENEFDLTTDETASYGAFKRVIQDERSRELCFEGTRRLDLMRWGILVSHMKELVTYIETTAPANYQYTATAGRNILEKHNYLPIPDWELSVNISPEMYQTEGWK